MRLQDDRIIARPPWIHEAPQATYPMLRGDHKADVVIIGGGLTGISAAYHLAKAGIPSIVLERDTVSSGATGASTGFVSAALEEEFDLFEIAEKFGLEFVVKRFAAFRRVRETLLALIERERIDCERSERGSLYVALQPSHRELLKLEYEFRRSLGADLQFLERPELLGRIAVEAHAAIYSATDFTINTNLLVTELCRRATSLTTDVYERSPVTSLEVSGYGVCARTPCGKVRAKAAFIATEGFPFTLQFLRGKVFPFWTSVIATEPLDFDIIQRLGWHGQEFLWDSYVFYNYAGKSTDGRVLFGGGNASIAKSRDPIGERRTLLRQLGEYFPLLKDRVTVSHQWGGPIGVTADETPLIGRLDPSLPVYFSGGYCGNGVAFGVHGGKMLAELHQGLDAPFADLYNPLRPLGGPWWFRWIDLLPPRGKELLARAYLRSKRMSDIIDRWKR